MNISKTCIRRYHFSVLFILLILFNFISCTNRERSNPLDPEYKGQALPINGLIQKGPFISGSNITIQELNEQLVPLGTTYSTQTTDDFGHYDPGNKFASAYVEVIATGFYFNEVSGSLSSANITIKNRSQAIFILFAEEIHPGKSPACTKLSYKIC